MKIKEGFKMRTVMGSSVVVAEGADHVDFNKLISLNESAALIWKAVEGVDFTVDDLARVLVNEYGIDMDTAVADAGEIARQWVEVGIVEP